MILIAYDDQWSVYYYCSCYGILNFTHENQYCTMISTGCYNPVSQSVSHSDRDAIIKLCWCIFFLWFFLYQIIIYFNFNCVSFFFFEYLHFANSYLIFDWIENQENIKNVIKILQVYRKHIVRSSRMFHFIREDDKITITTKRLINIIKCVKK